MTGKTRVFGIIGDPVSHSLSPLFQTRFAAQHGIDAVYVPLRVKSPDVASALDGLWAADIQGFNVTVPHKETVYDMVQADAAAACIGAVNSVRRGIDAWQGTNTDWRGISYVLQDMEVDVAGDSVLLLGAGGTARAVLHALLAEGAARVYVSNRSEDRLQALVRHAQDKYPDMPLIAVPWEAERLEVAMQDCPLIINTTSIGLGDPRVSFPFRILGEGVAVDAVYTPDGCTAFVAAALEGGRRAVDGLPMLLAQGAASFNWWHDVQPDVPPVRRWLEERLRRCRQAPVQ